MIVTHRRHLSASEIVRRVEATRGMDREIKLRNGGVVLDGIEVDGIVSLLVSRISPVGGIGAPTFVFDSTELVDVRIMEVKR